MHWSDSSVAEADHLKFGQTTVPTLLEACYMYVKPFMNGTKAKVEGFLSQENGSSTHQQPATSAVCGTMRAGLSMLTESEAT